MQNTFLRLIKTRVFQLGLVILTVIGLILSLFFYTKNKIEIEKLNQNTNQSNILVNELDNLLQIGQVYMGNYAQNDLSQLTVSDRYASLQHDLSIIPLFSQLTLYDATGRFITGFPMNSGQPLLESLGENGDIDLSKKQIITISKNLEKTKVTFINQLQTPTGAFSGFIRGDLDLIDNPMSGPLKTTINTIVNGNTSIYLLDEKQNYFFQAPNEKNLPAIELTSLASNNLVVEKRLVTNQWSAVLFSPSAEIFNETIDYSWPVALIVFIFAIIFYEFIKINQYKNFQVNKESPKLIPIPLNQQFNDLKKIFSKSKNVDQNDEFEISSHVEQLEEFKNEIINVKTIDDLGKTLVQNTTIDDADSIRCLFILATNKQQFAEIKTFGSGKDFEKYEYLDQQIISLVEKNQPLIISDIHHAHQINLNPGKEYPHSIFAYPIAMENKVYAIIWLAFKEERVITESENKLLSELVKISRQIIKNFVSLEIYKNIAQIQDVVLDKLDLPIFITDSDNKLIYFNKATQIQLPEVFEDSGSQIQKLLSNTDTPPTLSRENESGNSQKNIKTRSGKIFSVNDLCQTGVDGQSLRVYILNDETENILRKEQLEENISLLSHSLRSPLTTIKGYVSMIPMFGDLNNRQKDYLTKVQENIDEILKMVKELINYERLEMEGSVHFEDTDIIFLVNKIISSIMPFANQKQIEIKQDYDPNEHITLHVDSVLIEQAIKNLINNAIRYSPIKGKVNINIIKTTKTVEIKVKDSGIGISPIDLPHIFDKFYRVKISPENDLNDHSGIGLALVRSIAMKHHGDVEVISVLGEGSTFNFKIPLSFYNN